MSRKFHRMATVELRGREITYRIRRSQKARRIALRISRGGGLEVVLPRSAGVLNVDVLVTQHANWIIRKLDKMSKLPSSPLHEPLCSGASVLFAGEELTLKVIESEIRRAKVSRVGNELHVRVPSVDQTMVRNSLQDWYVRSARVLISKRVEVLNSGGRFRYSRVSIRNQRSRWGSCSRRGTLSFNWRLLLLPSGVMDYLICHEFAHLEQMNHSGRFWAIVEEICPGYRESEEWLKRYGPGLL